MVQSGQAVVQQQVNERGRLLASVDDPVALIFQRRLQFRNLHFRGPGYRGEHWCLYAGAAGAK